MTKVPTKVVNPPMNKLNFSIESFCPNQGFTLTEEAILGEMAISGRTN